MRGTILLLLVLLGAAGCLTPLAAAHATAEAAPHGSIADYYSIDNVETPPGLEAQVGSLAFSPSGKLFACFHRGEVYSYDPAGKQWKLFACGLHEPLGCLPLSDSEVLVMQRPELTRLVDSRQTGTADQYLTVSDAFGMSGNYHEFAFGPVMDPDGNYIIALNIASNGASIFPELRGEFRHYGITFEDFLSHWDASKGKAGRMYSVVPYRGWILKIDAKSGALTPLACGVRSPNGLGYDAHGHLLISDNQGDWLGGCKLFDIKPGNFYGHPASLVWRPGWDKRNPLEIPVAELDKMRTREAVMFPYEVGAKSATQPLLDASAGKFGPFAGQVFIGEMNTPRIMRLALEEVSGQLQGACIAFYDNAGLKPGTNRIAFDKDGVLWTGHTHLSWAGGDGIQRIRWNGKVPFDVLTMSLTADGFELTFTKPVDPATIRPEAFAFKRYYYEYHQAYGSPIMDARPIPVTSAVASKDGLGVTLKLGELKAGFLHELTLKGLKAGDGALPVNPLITYTVNRLRDGSGPPPWSASKEDKKDDKKKGN
jgi:hypothetical protein